MSDSSSDPGTNFGRALIILDRLTPKVQSVIILIDSVLFAALTYSLLMRVVPDPNRELVSAVVGFLAGNMVGPARAWLFGTTKGSEVKSQALADLASATAAAAPAAAAAAAGGSGLPAEPGAGEAAITAVPGEHVEIDVTKTTDPKPE